MSSQKVDQRKLDKAEAKLKEKKEKRINTDKKDSQPPIILEMATASQVGVEAPRLCDTPTLLSAGIRQCHIEI